MCTCLRARGQVPVTSSGRLLVIFRRQCGSVRARSKLLFCSRRVYTYTLLCLRVCVSFPPSFSFSLSPRFLMCLLWRLLCEGGCFSSFIFFFLFFFFCLSDTLRRNGWFTGRWWGGLARWVDRCPDAGARRPLWSGSAWAAGPCPSRIPCHAARNRSQTAPGSVAFHRLPEWWMKCCRNELVPSYFCILHI